MELDSEKPETGIGGGDMGSAVGKKVSEFHDVEFDREKLETKKHKSMLDVKCEEWGDDDVSPLVLYDRDSNQDPDKLFTYLAQLAIDVFIEMHSLQEARFLKLVKVTSYVTSGVMLTLTMNADLSGNPRHYPPFTEDQTLEAKIWYRGRLLKILADVLYVKVVCDSDSNNNIRKETDNKVAEPKLKETTDNKVAEPKLSCSPSDMDEDEEYLVYDRISAKTDPPISLFTEMAEKAIDFFNDYNRHMPYEVVELHKVTSSPGFMVNYTMTITAKPKPPHDTNPNAPPVQTFEAVVSYEGGEASDSTVLSVVIPTAPL